MKPTTDTEYIHKLVAEKESIYIKTLSLPFRMPEK